MDSHPTGLVALPLSPQQFGQMLMSLAWNERDAIHAPTPQEREERGRRATRIRDVLIRLGWGERDADLITEMRALLAAHAEDCARIEGSMLGKAVG